MRVLVLTCHLPLPPFSGGRRRELELLRRVAGSVYLEIVSITKTPDEDLRHLAEARALFGAVTVLPARRDDGPAAWQERRHRCPHAAAHVRAALRSADVVHAEGFYLLQHVPRGDDVPVLLGTQNVEHQLMQRRAMLAVAAHERAARVRDAEVTRRAELAAWRRAALLAAVTADDAAAMRAAVPWAAVAVVPDGRDHRSAHGDDLDGVVAVAGERPRVVMVGNYAYAPNVDAARWLVRDIAPRIAAEVPGLEVVLVGNAPPREVQELHDGHRVVVTGRVPAVEPWLRSARVVVCPLRFGGGIKVKVLEALASGCAVVGTPVAAEGLGPGAATAMRIAGDAGAFAARTAELLRRAEERTQLRTAARAFADGLPTWDDAAQALLGCYERLAAAPAACAP